MFHQILVNLLNNFKSVGLLLKTARSHKATFGEFPDFHEKPTIGFPLPEDAKVFSSSFRYIVVSMRIYI